MVIETIRSLGLETDTEDTQMAMEDIMVGTQIAMELDTAVRDTKLFLTTVAELIPLTIIIARVGIMHSNSLHIMEKDN